MQETAVPANEEARLQTLTRLNILDTPPEERFDRYTRLAQKVFNVPIAIISLTDRHRQWFKSRIGVEQTECDRQFSICAHTIMLNGGVFEIEDARNDPRFAQNPMVMAEGGVRFYAGAPLIVAGCHSVGTICIVNDKPRMLDESDKKTLSDIASMVADELVAYMDDLTGLSNRRGFRIAGERTVDDCKESGKTALLLMLDVDNFKQINDSYGHKEGDRVLIEFSHLLQGAFRESDIVARIGGDEFCVLLRDATPKDAKRCLKRLDKTLRDTNKRLALEYQLDFSSGVVAYEERRHGSINDLLRDADFQMYRIKSSKTPTRRTQDGRDVAAVWVGPQ